MPEQPQEEKVEEGNAAQYSTLDASRLAAQKKITDRLISWMEENGAEMPNLYFEYYAVDFRGVHISADLEDDALMVEIPPALLITVERAKRSAIGLEIARSGVSLRSHAYVACFLLQERSDPNSYWKPYLDVLPADFSHIPSQFTDEELYYLNGSLTMEEIEDRRQRYDREFRSLTRNVARMEKYTLQDYCWARLVVLTRIFGITVDGTDTSSLVPMADMLNHKYPAETFWTFDQSREAFTITSQKDFKAGEQVYDSYGRKCNTEFFMNYGFVPSEDNPNNECKLILSFPEDIEMFQYKLVVLPSDLHQVQVSMDYNTEECFEMWSYLRIGYATTNEFFQITDGEYSVSDPKDIAPVNLRNEMAVLIHLALFARQSLEEFDDSVEYDDQLLAEAEERKLSRNIQNAIKTRRSEKQVLHWYIEMCDLLVEILREGMSKPELVELFSGHPIISNTPGYKHYVNEVIIPLLDEEMNTRELISKFETMEVSNAPDDYDATQEVEIELEHEEEVEVE